MQLKIKKRFVYGAIAFIWIVIPAIEITFTAVTSDIVKETCVAFGVYRSYAMKQSVGFFTLVIAYFLPLAILVFCYARIVHRLRSKVIKFFVALRSLVLFLRLTEKIAGDATKFS